MISQTFDFSVIGGDMRQVYIARKLLDAGYRVCCFSLCNSSDADASEHSHTSFHVSETLMDAVRLSHTVIAPVPLSIDGSRLNTKTGSISLDDLADCLRSGQCLFAGCIPGAFSSALSRKNISVMDFMNSEELALYNSIATAEGAVAEAICQSPRNLHGSRCLILGYGKCAKTLASLLKGLHCQVHVCARNRVQQAEAAIFSDGVYDLHQLKQALKESDFIFNTVPALLLDREMLSLVRPYACILDLASAPGGTDFAEAQRLGLSARLMPGLPGRYAPESSAEAIVDLIIHEENAIRRESLCH